MKRKEIPPADAYYYYEGRIDAENAKALTDFITSNKGRLLIGITSAGGETSVMYYLLHILNENKDRIVLMNSCGVYSAAFYIFYHFKGDKVLAKGSMGMVHYGARNVPINYAQQMICGEDRSALEDYDFMKKETDRFAKFLTADEKKRLKKGEEVYLNFPRMREIFPDATIAL